MARHFVVTADGGSRGNPGAAAYGAVVYENDKVVKEIGAAIGEASNNVAEYSGLVAALAAAHEIDPNAQIEVRMDSKLVVEQMSGNWKIKHENMKGLVEKARNAFAQSQVKYVWVPREDNLAADTLLNIALDAELNQ
jgi:probable phosphoglycerate mutase